MKNFLSRVTTFFQKIKMGVGAVFGRSKRVVSAHAFPAFFGLMAILIGLTVIGNKLREPAPQPELKKAEPKIVQTFPISDVARLRFQAQVEKSGVLQIVAQAPGVIQKMNVKEGSSVKRGSVLFATSSNYVGGNTSTLSRQLTQKSYQFDVDTFDLQMDSINKRRQKAQQTEIDAAELRNIARQSIDETKNLISATEDLLTSLDAQIKHLEDTDVGGSNTQLILQLKQGRVQAIGTLNQTRNALRTTEYSSSEDKPEAQMKELDLQLAMQDLDLQEKSLALKRDIDLLSLKISRVTESLMFPAAPAAGVVERVYVHVGQVVNPGTLLASIRGNSDNATIVLPVSQDIARRVSRTEPTIIYYADGRKVEVMPRYISQEPTQGTLHTVMYSIPDALAPYFADKNTVQVDVPIGFAQWVVNDPYVPLDAMYQSQESAYIYVVGTNAEGQTIAQTKKITIGNVYGQYIEATGVDHKDVVILNRNILEGDIIKVAE